MTNTSWAKIRLEDITIKVGSGATPRGGELVYKNSGVPLIRSMNVVFFGFKREGLAFIDESQADALKNVQVHANDVLLNITGASIGRVTLAPADLQGARVNQHVCIIRPTAAIDPRYLRAFLSSPLMQSEITSENYGVTRAALTKGQILGFQIPLAPLGEQQRIADKLDALLARVDACRERLDRIPGILKRFRQSVLAAATSGGLTREWRESHSRSIESWRQSTVGALVERIEAGLNVQCDERPPAQDERGLVKISAVTWGVYDDAESKTLPRKADVPERSRIRVGDFLISRANTLELVGACVIVDRVNRPVFLSDKVLRLAMGDEWKQWLLICLQSPGGREAIENRASGNQLSMRNLSQANLREVSIPLPSPDERDEIVRRTTLLLTRAAELEEQNRRALRLVERLTSATLGKAFRGELVQQDSNEEPVSALLVRLRRGGSPKQDAVDQRTVRRRLQR